MSACPACATELPDGARFCFSCGATQGAPACASCGAALVPGARFCMECGSAQAATVPDGRLQPVSARRVTSVLFGDLVGFTTLSETRDQEETRELLSRYFDACRRIIERYGGTVEKFIGDAVMAVWGVPIAHEDDAERAVRAGLELVNAASSLGEELAVADLSMRVGIVTGEVAVTIGAEQQGMVAGDAVNTAARVQSVASAGQVWVDETTRLLTSAAITYLDVGSHLLRGKADPVPLWAVRAVVAAVGGAQRADGLEAPLVGRDRELRLMKELFHGVEEAAKPGLLVMEGEPGVGKSRLSWEFEKYIDGLSGSVRWHSGRCVAYGEGVAYFALAEAFRGRLQAILVDTEAAEEDVARLLEVGLERYVPQGDERDWLRPRLAALLGTGSVGTFPREDLFAAWTAFLQRVGEGHPVVLVIDDAQNADDGLLQFVEHLIGVASFRCLVILLSRPGLLERRPGLAANPRATVSHLEALGEREIGFLLDGLVAGVPEPARNSLIARSEGIPLFAVETVRSLIDRDLVIPRGGQYVLAEPDRLDLDSIGAPASLQALIAARLDALEPPQRRLVDLASVVGNVFTKEQVTELCATLGGVDEVDDVLTALLRLQILSVDTNRFSAGYGSFQFVQTVVRQVAYGTLSRRDRKAVHLAVAGQLEQAEDSGIDVAAIIAQHYLDAIESMPGDPDVPDLEVRVLSQLERAAARARSLGALTESAQHLETALARAQGVELRARLESALAWALLDAGDYQDAATHGEAAMAAFDELGDDVSAGIAAAAYSNAVALRGDTLLGTELVAQRWEDLQDVEGADQALLAVGQALVSAAGRRGVFRQDVVQRRIQIAERLGDHAQLADSLTGLSVDFSYQGAPYTAKVLMAAAADLARTHHLPVSLARCLSNLTVAEALEDLPRALAIAREGVEVADRSGVALWRDYTRANLALAMMSSGDWDELTHLISDASEIVTVNTPVVQSLWLLLANARGAPEPPEIVVVPVDSDDPTELAWLSFVRGLRALVAGDPAAAVPELSTAVDLMVVTAGVSDDLVQVWPVAVEAALLVEDDDAVSRLVRTLEEQVSKVHLPLGMLAHRARVAGLLARRTDADEAGARLADAVAKFDRWGAVPYRARTQVELGQWAASRGKVDQAETLLAAGRADLQALGAHGWLARLGLDAGVAPAVD